MTTIANLLIVAMLLWGSLSLFRYSMRRDRELQERAAERRQRAQRSVSAPAARPERADPPGGQPRGREPHRPSHGDSSGRPSLTAAGIPPGWTFREYVDDGLLQLQVFLTQQAHRSG